LKFLEQYQRFSRGLITFIVSMSKKNLSGKLYSPDKNRQTVLFEERSKWRKYGRKYQPLLHFC